MPEPRAESRPRNRDATRAALLDAALTTLSEHGFQAFGVNTVARQAGCDKQLIYRYFGGLDGLLEAMGQSLANWIGVSAEGAPGSKSAEESYADTMARLADGYLLALRDNRLVQKVLLWELSAPIDQVRPLADARGLALRHWMMRARGDAKPPEGIDFALINAAVIAIIHQMVLSSAAAGNFSGLSLCEDTDWQRLRTGLKTIIAKLYAAT